MSVIQSITTVPGPTAAHINTWILSSLENYPAARSLKRVAFVMPIGGVERLILVNQKNNTILCGSEVPKDLMPNDTLEIDGMFWTFLKAPEGADQVDAASTDIQDLTPHAEALDAVIPEHVDPTYNELLDGALADLETVGTANPTPAVPVNASGTTMEEVDNLLDAAMADIGTVGTEIKEVSMTADPTTATRRTLSVEDLDPAETPASTVEATDEQIAAEVLSETAAAEDTEGAAFNESAASLTGTDPDDQPTTKKAKAAKAPAPTPRERVVSKILDKLGLTQVPAPETVFAKFKDNKSVQWVPLGKLAVFNSLVAFDGDRTIIGRALNTLADGFGGENILNEAAEILPARVVEVATSILRHGRLVHLPKVANVDPETIPESVKNSHGELDASVLQVWDGRHRVAGFALLWDKSVLVPVLCEDKTFEEAYDDALISNDTREYGKKESSTYFGLTSEIQAGHDTAVAFALCKGSIADTTKWVVYQTTSKRDSDVFENLEVTVYDNVPKGSTGMTVPSYGNIVKGALSVVGKDNLKTLATAKPYIDLILLTINKMWDKVKVDAPERINNIWTSYGTQVLGKVIGEAIMKAVAMEVDYDPTAFAEKLVKAVLALIEVNPDTWNNTKPASLYEDLRSRANAKGIKLPRIGDKEGSSVLMK